MPSLGQLSVALGAIGAMVGAYYYNKKNNYITPEDITVKNVALGGLSVISVAGLYAAYSVKKFLAHVPYSKAPKASTLTAKLNLSSKVILITGTNSGIGEATTSALLKTKATIIAAVRNTKKAKDSLTKIDPTEGWKQNVVIMKCDLGSIKSIDEFVINFKQKYKKLDILICNAGIAPQREGLKTVDGYELAFGVNHLGHMHLTLSLLKELQNADEFGRVIVQSGDIFRYPIFQYDINKLNDHKTWPAYAHAKLCNVMFVFQFNQKYPFDKNNPKSVLMVSTHPGVGKTNLLEDRDDEGNVVLLSKELRTAILQYFGDTTEQLAFTPVYLATEDINKLVPGGYYCAKEKWDTCDTAKDKEKCAELWDVSMKYINDARKEI